MQHSSQRIHTTHVGSLPRPPDLAEVVVSASMGEWIDEAAFASRLAEAVHEVVRQQVEAGIDIVSDGEFSKPSFASYVAMRLEGFGGQNPEPRIFTDFEAFPNWAAQAFGSVGRDPRAPVVQRPMCCGPLAYRDTSGLQRDIQNLRSAAATARALQAFMPAASLGIIAEIMTNRYYDSERSYLYALADAMKAEYTAIAAAGLIVQVDAPDAAMGRSSQFRHASTQEFRNAVGERVDALNHALADIPDDQIRYHVCWGNMATPHVGDVPLREIVDLILRVKAGAYSIEASNPRHAHEWAVWQDVKLPDGKILIPGVIDSTSNYVEHPELVAQRIVQYARLVGRDNVIAGTDCGFGTFVGMPLVHPDIMWAKLRTLAEGAALASKELW
jgi:5-methyltetrahydropteroyltriglutamate--homocysteine methyltransferase